MEVRLPPVASSRLFAHYGEDGCHVVGFTCFIFLERATSGTPVGNDRASALVLYPHRLHQATTPLSPISGIIIHMLAPETFGAVVGIAIPLHMLLAILANKILNYTFECYTQIYM